MQIPPLGVLWRRLTFILFTDFFFHLFICLFIFQIQLLLLLLKYFLWSDIWNVSYIELRIWNVQTPLKSWLLQASIRNCLNCVHNCDDHGLLEIFLLCLFCPRLEWEYLCPALLVVLMTVLMVFHKILGSAKSMSFHSFSQNPTIYAKSSHGSLHEKLLVSAKLVNFDGFS